MPVLFDQVSRFVAFDNPVAGENQPSKGLELVGYKSIDSLAVVIEPMVAVEGGYNPDHDVYCHWNLPIV